MRFFILLLLFVAVFQFFPVSSANAALVPCGSEGQPDCNFCHLFQLGHNVIDFFLAPPPAGTGIVFILAVLFLVIGGFLFLVSPANPSLQGRARQIILAVFIGLAIIYGAWLFINLLLTSFGFGSWGGFGNWWEITCEF